MTSSNGREFGFWTAVALVVGNMIGSGVFLLPASLAPYGGLSFAGWAVSAAGSVMLALVFARFARANPAAGGPYAYTRAAFGDLPGFLVGWGYWVSVWSANAALAVAFVGYLAAFIPSVAGKEATAAIAIGAIWLFTLVNVRGVGAVGRVQVVTTVLKALPLAFVGVLGIAHFSPDAFKLPAASASGPAADLMSVVTLTLWAFLGLESATIPAGAVKDAARTISRATVTGTLVAAGIYVISTAGVMSLIPAAALSTSTAPFADAARALAGGPAAAAVAVGAAVSCLGALNGWTLMVGQMPMAMAADGVFPAVFGRLSTRGTPAIGFVIGASLSTMLLLVDLVQSRLASAASSTALVTLFTRMILISTLSTLVPYFCCSLAALLSRGTGDDAARRRAGSGARAIAALALIYSAIAIVGAGGEVIVWGAALLLAGLPVYFWIMKRRPGPIAA